MLSEEDVKCISSLCDILIDVHKKIWTDKSPRIGPQTKHLSSVIWSSVDLVIVVMFVMWIDRRIGLSYYVCYFVNLSELSQWKMILEKSSRNKGFSHIEKGIIYKDLILNIFYNFISTAVIPLNNSKLKWSQQIIFWVVF